MIDPILNLAVLLARAFIALNNWPAYKLWGSEFIDWKLGLWPSPDIEDIPDYR